MSSVLNTSDDSKKIVVVGSANQDLTSTSDILPTLGETVMGKEFTTACGGKGANQAVAAAMLRLGPGTKLFYIVFATIIISIISHIVPLKLESSQSK